MNETDALAAESIEAAGNLHSLRELFGRHVRRFGFNAYAAGIIPQQTNGATISSDPFLFIDWPRAWLELYAREGFAKDDLLIAEALTRTEPLTWTEFRASRPDASARIFRAASGFGWEDGMLIPIRPPGGRGPVGVVSLAAPARLALDDSGRIEVASISRLAFARARVLNEEAQSGTALSERERTALSLVARGYSDAQIARELGISRDTSHLHVERAKRRLGATTRAQAVAIAIGQGLLPRD